MKYRGLDPRTRLLRWLLFIAAVGVILLVYGLLVLAAYFLAAPRSDDTIMVRLLPISFGITSAWP